MMIKEYIFSYSLLWRFRYLLSFLVTGLVFLSLFCIFVEIDFDNFLSAIFLWMISGVMYLISAFKEKKNIVNEVRFVGEQFLVKLYKSQESFKKSDIQFIRYNKLSKTLNGFGVKEMVIVLWNNKEFVIPTNISSYNELSNLVESKS